LRLAALRQFARWLVSEGELPGIKPPNIATNRLTASPTSSCALLEACKSSSFRGKRDEAIVRLMAETGLRASETVALTVADVQPFKNGPVAVRPARA
jgi:site-specific recombinase XerC